MRFHGGDDILAIADSAYYLAPISEIDRARKYPITPHRVALFCQTVICFISMSRISAMITKMVFWLAEQRFYRLGQIGRRCNCCGNLA